MDLNTYLTFDGHAREALAFYAETLGGELAPIMAFSDLPDGSPVSPDVADRVAHGRLTINGRNIMVSDTWTPGDHKGFSGFSIQTDWDDIAAAKSAFERMADGGTVTMPFGPTFWARGFGTCTDRFGVSWMFNVEAEGVH